VRKQGRVRQHRRSQGCTGCTCTPRVEKNFFPATFSAESCKCTPRPCTPQTEQKSIFQEIREICRVGVVDLVVLARGLRVTTKKGRQLFRGRKVHHRENPGYAYVHQSDGLC